MAARFIILLTILGFLVPLISGPLQANDLPLDEIRKLKVLLFESDFPESLTISAHDGSISIPKNSFTLSDKEPAFAVRVLRNRIIYRAGGEDITTDYIELDTDDTSMIRVYHPRLGIRYYRGSIRISLNRNGNTLRLINTVGLEDYIGSVVGGEMNFPEMEALKVQAVIARTYALWSLATSRNLDYQLTDHTLNQVYNGMLISRPDYLRAALATSGEILTWSGKLILAAYSSTCGGTTNNNESLWSGGPLPYLRSIQDGEACSVSPHFEWEYEVEKRRLHQTLQKQTGRSVSGFQIAGSDKSGLVTSIHAVSGGNQKTEIPANTFRLLVNRELERSSIRSTRFTVTEKENTYLFRGNGLGHGIGLCQWGARGLAQSGWNYRDILRFYYSGVEVTDLYSLTADKLELAR